MYARGGYDPRPNVPPPPVGRPVPRDDDRGRFVGRARETATVTASKPARTPLAAATASTPFARNATAKVTTTTTVATGHSTSTSANIATRSSKATTPAIAAVASHHRLARSAQS